MQRNYLIQHLIDRERQEAAYQEILRWCNEVFPGTQRTQLPAPQALIKLPVREEPCDAPMHQVEAG